MAVYIVGHLDTVVVEALDRLADDGVSIAKSNAPHDSGALEDSIHKEVTGLYSRKVTTNAAGSSGKKANKKRFEYPARIEAGDEVIPSGRYKHNFGAGPEPAIWFKGRWHKKAGASAKSGFMEKTMNMLHI